MANSLLAACAALLTALHVGGAAAAARAP
jgi:hypothetical protein